MKVAVFSSRNYDVEFLNAVNASRHELRFYEPHLNEETVGLAAGFGAVCVFVNDRVNAVVIAKLASLGVRLIALRCAGYNNVDPVEYDTFSLMNYSSSPTSSPCIARLRLRTSI